MNTSNVIKLLIEEGEGQKIEFKQSFNNNIAKDMVAFANSSGGAIFIGISDDKKITPLNFTNSLISQMQDLANNCEPKISIIVEKMDQIIKITVKEGQNKPYCCKDGFFLRIGPNSQKLSRDEIIGFVKNEGKVRFDEIINDKFKYKDDFDQEKFDKFRTLSNISLIPTDTKDLLLNLNVAEVQSGELLFNNAGVLFFSKNPQKFFKEACITCIKYRGNDRYEIIDKKDLAGNPIDQIEAAIHFFKNHVKTEILISSEARHKEAWEYPIKAVREAIINAVMHRDYFYDSSRIYMHFFQDKLEIENPGGLFKGLQIEDLGKRSVRRNLLVSDLLYRANYIEMIGSGITRMRKALEKNGNPEFEISASNFFSIRFFPRLFDGLEELSIRQREILNYVKAKGLFKVSDLVFHFKKSNDTILRDLKELIKLKLIIRIGTGKTTNYKINF
ncbi:MAG: RNA-binding domain-containing protein [Pseudomonadota bacterium]